MIEIWYSKQMMLLLHDHALLHFVNNICNCTVKFSGSMVLKILMNDIHFMDILNIDSIHCQGAKTETETSPEMLIVQP